MFNNNISILLNKKVEVIDIKQKKIKIHDKSLGGAEL
jgi:hypothetical protein